MYERVFRRYEKRFRCLTIDISQIIDALVQDGYIVLEDALDPQLTQELLAFAQAQTNFQQAGISKSSSQHLDSTKRKDKTLWLNETSAPEKKYLAFISQLQTSLNRELYLGVNYYESHFALYEEGDFYEKHLDAFKNSKNRVVTTVYYLNKEHSTQDGGELVIYDADDNVIQEVTPQANTLVVFLSDTFPHEVKPAKTKRYSIAGWFRIDK